MSLETGGVVAGLESEVPPELRDRVGNGDDVTVALR